MSHSGNEPIRFLCGRRSILELMALRDQPRHQDLLAAKLGFERWMHICLLVPGTRRLTNRRYATAGLRCIPRIMCERYEELREVWQAALREWDLAVIAPKWTIDSSSRLAEAAVMRDEALDLLAQHKSECLVCSREDVSAAAS